MKAQQQVFDFLQGMGNNTLLAVAGEMVPFSNNSFDNARFLSQLLFWADDRGEWTPITFKEWKGTARLSRYAVEKARFYFYNLGILEYQVKKDGQGNPTAHYKLNFKALMNELKKFFKDAVKSVFSGYAELFKCKRGQAINNMRTQAKPLYKERLEPESIGQIIKKGSQQRDPSRYDRFYA